MRALVAEKTGEFRTITEAADIAAILAGADGLLWVDLPGRQLDRSAEALLTETFGFHPLAVDDALHETHVPKLDDWQSYLYLVFQDATYETAMRLLTLPELDVFLGKQYLVTYHQQPLSAVDRVWQTCLHNPRWLHHGADHVLYRIIDELVNDYMHVVDMLEDTLLQLEDRIFAAPTPDLLEEVFDHKRNALKLRRVLNPQREVLGKLARDVYPVIGAKDRVFFRDVHDHMIRLYDRSDTMRDLALGNMDIYLSVVNNRMNDVMKTLTVITTLFMPLSFLTGFFGMNFFSATVPLRHWTGGFAFGLVLVLIGLLPIGMLWWMRQRNWM